MALGNRKHHAHNFKDLTGRRFGRLMVREYAGCREGRSFWRCDCQCGSEAVIYSYSLTRGASVSCGCGVREATRWRNTKHGRSHLPEYNSWANMKQRCFNKNNKNYEQYGARGITVCDEWKDDFGAFLRYIGRRPSSRHSVDRYPNGNGSYEPGNVRWATPTQQSANSSTIRLISFGGTTLYLSEWATRIGLCPSSLLSRFDRGWSLKEALTTPRLKSRYDR